MTGTVGDASHQFPIEKGEVNGNSVTFQVTAGAVLTFNLRQEGDVMNGTAKIVHDDGTVHEGPVSLRRK